MLTKDNVHVIELTTLRTKEETKITILAKLMLPVPNEKELKDFYIGTTRVLMLNRFDKNEPLTESEMASQQETIVNSALTWLNMRLNKALTDGEATYEDLPTVKLDKERYGEIQVIPYGDNDHAFMDRITAMCLKPDSGQPIMPKPDK